MAGGAAISGRRIGVRSSPAEAAWLAPPRAALRSWARPDHDLLTALSAARGFRTYRKTTWRGGAQTNRE